jgi:hypothetical protein
MLHSDLPAPFLIGLTILGGLFAGGGEALQLGFILFELAAKARFLDGKIIQIAPVGEKDLGFDHGFADRFVLFVRKLPGQLAAADGVNSGFERGNALQPPKRIGEGMGEALFFIFNGGELLENSFDVRLIGRAVVRWQEDGAAGETGFQGVVGDLGFSFRRSGAAG